MRTKYRNGAENKRAHVHVAEQALGKPLPYGAVVHHIDGNGLNNAPDNLVICPSEQYHQLLHLRQRALDEGGNPEFRKCPFCKQWSHPQEMIVVGDVPGRNSRFCHRKCKCEYEKKRRAASREAAHV